MCPRTRGAPKPMMLDRLKSRRLDEPIAVSLEEVAPRDHFYRHMEATLDLSFDVKANARVRDVRGRVRVAYTARLTGG
jgi:hypothetical protein